MYAVRRALLEHAGLSRPFRFERSLIVLVASAFAIVIAGLALDLGLNDRLALATLRGWYFIWLATLILLGALLTRWPGCAAAVLSLAAVDIGLGLGSAVLVKIGAADSSIMPGNYPPEETEFMWHPLLQAVPRPTDKPSTAGFFHNSERRRGPERTPQSMNGKIVAAVFGGSTTYDLGVPDGKTWPEQLERLLGSTAYTVINHGTAGLATVEHVIQTAFYERSFGVMPRCSAYYIGWNDLQSAHLPTLDPGYADFHLPTMLDAQGARRISSRWLPISPTLRYVARLAVLAFDTPRPPVWPTGPLSADPDPALEGIYARNISTISAINRQRGIRTIWIGQLMNRPALNLDTSHGWVPLVRDRDVWPLIGRLNAIAQSQAASLGDVYADIPIDDFDTDDFIDQGHFSAAGSLKFASWLAPIIADACR